jgi:hypothetical protein
VSRNTVLRRIFEPKRQEVMMMMMMTAFWHIAPCSVFELGRRLRGAQCLDHIPNDGGNAHL